VRDLSHYGAHHVADHCAMLRRECTPEIRELTREDRTWLQITPERSQARLTQIQVVLNRLRLTPAGLGTWMGVSDPLRALYSLPDRILHMVLAWLATDAGLAEYREAITFTPDPDARLYVDPSRISGRD